MNIVHITSWLDKLRHRYEVSLEETGIKDLKGWVVNEDATIEHESGRFFSIIGIQIKGAEEREVPFWSQPIMKQNECGILGMVRKNVDGNHHYLLQAKFEPGNIGFLQLSPTLQATKSNLECVHKGKRPFLSEFFTGEQPVETIIDIESVEDGGRFYKKTNRNIVVEVAPSKISELPENFIWVTKDEFKALLREPLLVNSLVRSVMGSVYGIE